MSIKMDQETAEAVVELMGHPRFSRYLAWVDGLHSAFVADAINGVSDKYSPDVLRGRAQALGIMKQELGKAPETASRILKPHQRKKPLAEAIRGGVNGSA